jgi:hypothetical protein
MPTTDMNMNATPCMTATTSDDGSGGVCYGYNYSREYWVGYGMLLSGRLEAPDFIRTDVTVIALPPPAVPSATTSTDGRVSPATVIEGSIPGRSANKTSNEVDQVGDGWSRRSCRY